MIAADVMTRSVEELDVLIELESNSSSAGLSAEATTIQKVNGNVLLEIQKAPV